MHRCIMIYDIPPAIEFHPPCVGASLFTWWGPIPFIQKHAKHVEIGPFPGNNPIGMGHDTGPGRVHVMVCPSIEPISATAASILMSLLCTSTAACKPMFCAHKVQLDVGGASLPVCADPIPYCIPLFGGIVCSLPGLPTGMHLPTEYRVFVGMTWGDIVGGIINVACESAWQAAWEATPFAKAGRVALKLLGKGGKLAKAITEAIFGSAPGWMSTGAAAGNAGTGPTNIGQFAQQAMDGDGVGSDARPALGVAGFGVSTHSSSDPAGDNETPGETDRWRFTHPWSAAPSGDDGWAL